MSARDAALWQAALELVGTPFRYHGHGCEGGLDCVGLVAEACRRAGHPAPSALPRYALRATGAEQAKAWLGAAGLMPRTAPGAADIVLTDAGRGQLHLIIARAEAHIHAHAGIGRVVLVPGAAGWPVLARWGLPD
jgi:murein DD-endopeptidase / murein LD-carboxypeptidase